jgi:hypothetical protein
MKRNYLMLFLFVFFMTFCSKTDQLSSDEKALLLTVEDFAGVGIKKYNPLHATFFKKRNLYNRSQELNYEYEYDASADATPFYLRCIISLEKTKFDTDLTQSAFKLGLLIGFKKSGVKEKPLTGFPKYGDQSSMSLLEKDGKTIGNIFMMVSGSKSYFIVFSGLFIDDSKIWNKVFGPKGGLFEKFKVQ